jgi:nitrogen fixation protein NifB
MRPGVASKVLSPEAARDRVTVALRECPEITVAGIAGPGDPLASDHAIRAFGLIHEQHPSLIKCMSTNGLRLAEKADALFDVGVRSITVTVNAVDPAILENIVPRVVDEGTVLAGRAAAERLINRQLHGIAKVVALGAFVKINVVLIPGVNDFHVGEVARTTAALGAGRINLIPLIPSNGFADHRPPSCKEIEDARRAAEEHLPVFRHCQRCRADACGIPGKKSLVFNDTQTELEVATTFSHG